MMRYVIFFVLFGLTVLAGCQNQIQPQVKIVTVDKPIPFCPPPPDIPVCTNYVANLTIADSKDPGKVAQSYVADLACYKANDVSFRQALQHYGDIAKQATQVQLMLNNVQTNSTSAVNAVQPVSTPTK